MCKKILNNIDEDTRLGLKKSIRLVSDILGWVPTFIQGLVGAVADVL